MAFELQAEEGRERGTGKKEGGKREGGKEAPFVGPLPLLLLLLLLAE